MKMKIITAILVLACMHSAWAKKKKATTPAPTCANVAYDEHERTKLDFWQAEGEGPRPVWIFIHGGGWIGGKKQCPGGAKSWLEKGVSIAAINYRLSETDPLPAPVHDAVRAIQFLRSKANEWNIDKDKFFLTGGSAGGCTSVLIACLDDFADPDSEDPISVLTASTAVFSPPESAAINNLQSK